MLTRSLPIPGILLCATGSTLLAVAGVPAFLVLAVALVWFGSLLIQQPASAEINAIRNDTSFPMAYMSDLFEQSQTPLLVTRRDRVIIANAAARNVLGEHVLGQDVRISLRQPEAVRLIDSGESGSANVRGMVRVRDVWRINRKSLDEDLAVFEFVNRTAEQDMRRAHTDFVANASHELRTPLASILGYVETLRDGAMADEPKLADRFLDTIEREAKRLQALVSDLMSLSRIEAEKHDAPSTPIDMSALVERAARDATGMDRQDRLALDIDPDIVIGGDEQQLEQLVRNLVDNAFKYGAKDRPVSVALQAGARLRVTMTVSDEGDGVPSEHLPHLTRRFYRTDPGRSRASGGTGLGLAIVKHIVERHGGRLVIDSQPGKGTQVRITLRALP